MISLLVSLLVVGLPVAGPEQEVAPCVFGAAAGPQRNVAAASNGEVTLVIWRDERKGYDLFGARLDPSGKPLDNADLLLAEGMVPGAVAWNGRAFVALAVDGNLQTWSLLLAPDGTPLREPKPFRVKPGTLASNGQQVVLAGWTVSDRSILLFLDDDGMPGRTLRFGDYEAPVVTADGEEWIVALREETTTHLLRLRSTGETIEDRAIAVVPILPDAIATSGDRTLVAQREISGGFTRVRYFVTDRAGNVLVPTTVIDAAPLKSTPPVSDHGGTTATFDGSRFTLAWSTIDGQGKSDVRAMHFTRDGAQMETAPLVIESATEGGVWTGTSPVFAGSLLLWPSSRSALVPAYDVVSRLAETLATKTTTPTIVSRSAAAQSAPMFAAGDDAVFAVWRQTIAEPSIAARVLPFYGQAGNPITVLASAVTVQDVAVAASGGVYAVGWRESDPLNNTYRIRVHLFDRTGRPLLGAPLQIVSDTYVTDRPVTPRSLAIAGDGTQFLVAWVSGDARIRGARLTTRGVLLDRTPKPVSSVAFTSRGDVHVFRRPSDFLVVWREDATMRGTRISPNGDWVDAAFYLYRGSVPGPVAAEWNGRELLLAWQQNGCGSAQRFTLEGTAIDATPVTLPCGIAPGRLPIAFDGTNWWIAAPDAATGIRLGGVPFPIESEALTAQLVATPNGVLAGYMRVSPAAGYVSRVFLRRITDPLPKQRAIRR